MNLVTKDVAQGKIGQASQTVVAAATPGKRALGELRGLIQFRGQDEDPQVISASLYALQPSNVAFAPGPLVAIIGWGAGDGGQHVAEVDLPSTQYSQATKEAFGGIGVGNGSGCIISVPCTTLEIACRNDGALIPPIGNTPIGSSIDGQAQAHIGVGNRASGSGQLFRTIWQVNGTAGNGLAAAATTEIVIPPFARSVRVMRGTVNNFGGAALGTAPAFRVGKVGINGQLVDPIVVAADAACPEIPLSGSDALLGITNTGGVEILVMYALFTIQL